MKRRGNAIVGGKHRQLGKSQVARPVKSAINIGLIDLWIIVALVVGTFVIYGQVINHQFINFDDDLYVRDNAMVSAGLTLQGIGWAFTTFHSANWHPLTWLSHMLDCQLFGLSVGKHL